MSNLSISGLAAFRAVAQKGSIRAAAASLLLEPSTVSHQLKALEQQLGVTLFMRTTRSVNLTDAGRVLLQSAVPAMEQLEEALDRCKQTGSARKGILRMNMPYIGYEIALTDRLSEFQQRYPEITLEFSFSDRFVDIVAEGFHAGIRFGGRIQEDMVAIALTGPTEASVIGSPEYLEKIGIPKQPADLLRHNCLRYRFIGSQRIADWDFMGPDGHFTVAVKGNFTADLQIALLDRVLAGDGLAHLPTAFVKTQLDNQTVVRLLEDYTYPYPALYLYYPRQNRQTETLRTFVEFFKQSQ